MAILSWGRCTVYARRTDTSTPSTWVKFPIPADGTATLETSKGDKLEAKVEGGGVEAVKYNKSTYVLNATVRAAAGRAKPIEDTDGVVEGEYEAVLTPENIKAPGLWLPRSAVSVEEKYDTKEGLQWSYAFDALENEEYSQKEGGIVTLGSDGLPSEFEPTDKTKTKKTFA